MNGNHWLNKYVYGQNGGFSRGQNAEPADVKGRPIVFHQ